MESRMSDRLLGLSEWISTFESEQEEEWQASFAPDSSVPKRETFLQIESRPTDFGEPAVSADYTRRLPAELLGHIFHHSLSRPWVKPRMTTAPCILGHICSRWRIIACSLSGLWCKDCIRRRHTQSPSRRYRCIAEALNIWLERSGLGTCPLTLRWDAFYEEIEWQRLYDVLLSTSSRRRRIELRIHPSVADRRFYDPSHDLSLLDKLILSFDQYDVLPRMHDNAFQHAPNLMHSFSVHSPFSKALYLLM